MSLPSLAANKIVPVVVIDEVAAALPLAETLLSAGISTMEVTLRTPNALQVIETLAKHAPQMLVGAGTVRNKADFTNAVNAGAKYIISPGVTASLLQVASNMRAQVQYIPGIVTPGQAMECAEQGFNQLKFFPAEPYNAYEVIKALASPLPDIKFCPTGGITVENMAKYLSLANIFAVGLSSIVDSKLIASHNFSEIAGRAKHAVTILQQTLNTKP